MAGVTARGRFPPHICGVSRSSLCALRILHYSPYEFFTIRRRRIFHYERSEYFILMLNLKTRVSG